MLSESPIVNWVIDSGSPRGPAAVQDGAPIAKPKSRPNTHAIPALFPERGAGLALAPTAQINVAQQCIVSFSTIDTTCRDLDKPSQPKCLSASVHEEPRVL